MVMPSWVKVAISMGIFVSSYSVAQDRGSNRSSAGVPKCPGSVLCPARDARGIPVISDPATVPAGFNHPVGMGGPTAGPTPPLPTQPAAESYPPCSRTVTDNCVQTYERGRSPR